MTLVESVRAEPVATSRDTLTVDIAASFDDAIATWEQLAARDAVLPFQRRPWLEAWSETFGREPGVETIAATVRDADGTPIMGLPLTIRRSGLLREICPVDDGVSDYNAPILSERVRTDSDGAQRLWNAVLSALPPADIVRFERMPAHVGTIPNPLALLPAARPSQVDGLALRMDRSYTAWRGALPRRYRMELGRCGRLFDDLPGARFERIFGDPEPVFDALEQLQRERIADLGLDYRLDRTTARAFYRRLVDDLSEGPGILTALTSRQGIIAVLFGVRHADHYVMLRIAACPAHARLSPARLLITRTMQLLAADGVRCFDFGLGDYTYKRKLGGRPMHLRDLVVARSPLGLAEVAGTRLKARVRSTPGLRMAVSRLRGIWQRDRSRSQTT